MGAPLCGYPIRCAGLCITGDTGAGLTTKPPALDGPGDRQVLLTVVEELVSTSSPSPRTLWQPT